MARYSVKTIAAAVGAVLGFATAGAWAAQDDFLARQLQLTDGYTGAFEAQGSEGAMGRPGSREAGVPAWLEHQLSLSDGHDHAAYTRTLEARGPEGREGVKPASDAERARFDRVQNELSRSDGSF